MSTVDAARYWLSQIEAGRRIGPIYASTVAMHGKMDADAVVERLIDELSGVSWNDRDAMRAALRAVIASPTKRMVG